MNFILYVVIFIFGALIGSFLNVLILRLPKSQTLTGRSVCIHCRHSLAYYDLFPLISYLSLGGRCRYCQKSISPRYFIIELVSGLLFVFVAINSFMSGSFEIALMARALIVLSLLIVIFVIDYEHFLILDSILIFGVVFVILANIVLDFLLFGSITLSFTSFLVSGLLGGAVAFAMFYLLWFFSKGRWMGFGDVKLVFFLGLVVGWPLILLLLMPALKSGLGLAVLETSKS
jgi:leader peptidase (prepilin peptidase)/N-methyltransferase